MSSLIPFEPFNEMMSLRDAMDRLFEDSFVRPRFGELIPRVGFGEMAIDMYETKDDVVVKTALPGVKPEDVDVTITGDVLSIKGETKEEKETQGDNQNYLRRERRYGAFSRSITLPSGLQVDKAQASFENGVLTLRVPKSEQAKPKSIKIQAKSSKS
jgi:HSP20 family protein